MCEMCEVLAVKDGEVDAQVLQVLVGGYLERLVALQQYVNAAVEAGCTGTLLVELTEHVVEELHEWPITLHHNLAALSSFAARLRRRISRSN